MSLYDQKHNHLVPRKYRPDFALDPWGGGCTKHLVRLFGPLFRQPVSAPKLTSLHRAVQTPGSVFNNKCGSSSDACQNTTPNRDEGASYTVDTQHVDLRKVLTVKPREAERDLARLFGREREGERGRDR